MLQIHVYLSDKLQIRQRAGKRLHSITMHQVSYGTSVSKNLIYTNKQHQLLR